MCSRKSSQPQNSWIDLGFALAHFKGKLPKRMIDTGGLAKKIESHTALKLRLRNKSMAKQRSG